MTGYSPAPFAARPQGGAYTPAAGRGMGPPAPGGAQSSGQRSLVVKFYDKDSGEDSWSIVKAGIPSPTVTGAYLRQMVASEARTTGGRIKFWDFEEEGFISLRDDDVFHLSETSKTVVLLQLDSKAAPLDSRVRFTGTGAAVPMAGADLSVHVVLGESQDFKLAPTATIRDLLNAAARHWNVPAQDLEVQGDGTVLSLDASVARECESQRRDPDQVPNLFRLTRRTGGDFNPFQGQQQQQQQQQYPNQGQGFYNGGPQQSQQYPNQNQNQGLYRTNSGQQQNQQYPNQSHQNQGLYRTNSGQQPQTPLNNQFNTPSHTPLRPSLSYTLPSPSAPLPNPHDLPPWGGQIDLSAVREWGNLSLDPQHPLVQRVHEACSVLETWFDAWSASRDGVPTNTSTLQLPAIVGAPGIGKTKLLSEVARSPWTSARIKDRFLQGNPRQRQQRTLFLNALQQSTNAALTVGIDFGQLASAGSLLGDNPDEGLALAALFFGLQKYRGHAVQFQQQLVAVPAVSISLESFVKMARTQFRRFAEQYSVLKALGLFLAGDAYLDRLPPFSLADALRFLRDLHVSNPFQRIPAMPVVGTEHDYRAAEAAAGDFAILALDNVDALTDAHLAQVLKVVAAVYADAQAMPVLAARAAAPLRSCAAAAGVFVAEPVALGPIASVAAFHEMVRLAVGLEPPTDPAVQARSRFERGERLVVMGDRTYASPDLWTEIDAALRLAAGVPRLFGAIVDYLAKEKEHGPQTTTLEDHVVAAADQFYGARALAVWDKWDPVAVLHVLTLSILATPLTANDPLFPPRLCEALGVDPRSDLYAYTVATAEAHGLVFTQMYADRRRAVIVPEALFRLWRQSSRSAFRVPEALALCFGPSGLAPDLESVCPFSDRSKTELFGPRDAPPAPTEHDPVYHAVVVLQFRTRQMSLYRQQVACEDILVGCPAAIRSQRVLGMDRRVLRNPFPHEVQYDRFRRDIIDPGFVVRNPAGGRYADILLILEDTASRARTAFPRTVVGIDMQLDPAPSAGAIATAFLNNTFRVGRRDGVDYLISVRPFARPHQHFPDPANRAFADEVKGELTALARRDNLPVDAVLDTWSRIHVHIPARNLLLRPPQPQQQQQQQSLPQQHHQHQHPQQQPYPMLPDPRGRPPRR